MASDPTSPSTPSIVASNAAQAPSTYPSPESLPHPFDPFASDPAQSPANGVAASASSTDSSSVSFLNPFAPDPFHASTNGGGTPASGGTTAPQTGIWLNEPDPQFLIQWTLQEAQAQQPATQTASQALPSDTYQARVRIFQEIFETNLAAMRPTVPFSLRDAITGSLYLQGSLVLLQQPLTPPVLLVKNLKFSGFQQAQVMLFPSVSDVPGALSNATEGNESGG